MVLNMAKKPINKFLLLPLFLGTVCLLSAGLIAGVNSFTEPKINQMVIDRQNAGYYKVLGIESADLPVDKEISQALASDGVTSKKEFKSGDALIGYVYDVTVTGYGGPIKFQVGFKDNNFSGFNIITHGETTTYGGVVIPQVDGRIKGQSASSDVLGLINGTDNLTAGKSETGNALVAGITACAEDYLAEVA